MVLALLVKVGSDRWPSSLLVARRWWWHLPLLVWHTIHHRQWTIDVGLAYHPVVILEQSTLDQCTIQRWWWIHRRWVSVPTVGNDGTIIVGLAYHPAVTMKTPMSSWYTIRRWWLKQQHQSSVPSGGLVYHQATLFTPLVMNPRTREHKEDSKVCSWTLSGCCIYHMLAVLNSHF